MINDVWFFSRDKSITYISMYIKLTLYIYTHAHKKNLFVKGIVKS